MWVMWLKLKLVNQDEAGGKKLYYPDVNVC